MCVSLKLDRSWFPPRSSSGRLCNSDYLQDMSSGEKLRLTASALQKKGSKTGKEAESAGTVGDAVCSIDGDDGSSGGRANRGLGGSRGDLSGSGQDGGRGRSADDNGGAVGVGRERRRAVSRGAVRSGGHRGRLRVNDGAGAVGDGDGGGLSDGVSGVLVGPGGGRRAVGGVLGDNDGGQDGLLSLGESQQAGEGDELSESHFDKWSSSVEGCRLARVGEVGRGFRLRASESELR